MGKAGSLPRKCSGKNIVKHSTKEGKYIGKSETEFIVGEIRAKQHTNFGHHRGERLEQNVGGGSLNHWPEAVQVD